MKIFKTFQVIDLAFQSLLIAGVGLPLLVSIFNPEYLLWSLMGLLPLGAWQLFSAFVLGLGLSDKYRQLYLLTAVTFCGLFFSGGFLLDRLHWSVFAGSSIYSEIPKYLFFVILIISFVAALYYFTYSYRHYQIGKKHNGL